MTDNKPDKKPEKRGRPPRYDRQAVIRQMRNLFWENGVANVSLDDISRETGMHRPSLYAAFGDKNAMYQHALDAVLNMVRNAVKDITENHDDLHSRLNQFFDRAIALYTSGEGGGRGCFYICTATVEAFHNDQVRTALGGMVAMLDQQLTSWFEDAQRNGELDPTYAPADLGQLYASQLHSMAIRARSGTSPEALQIMKEQLFTILPWQNAPGTKHTPRL